MTLINFYTSFFKVGIAALVVQFITGFRMGMTFLPVGEWFSFDKAASTLIVLKLALLVMLIILVFRARYFCLPKEGGKLTFISINIYITTIVSIILMLVGLSFRITIF